MGLAGPHIAYIGSRFAQHGIAGHCVTLGRMTVLPSLHECMRILASHGVLPINDGGQVLFPSDHPFMRRARGTASQDRPATDDDVFSLLGCHALTSIDISPYEGATLIYDLNMPGLSERLPAPADVLLEAGTIEHIFHLPNVLANIAQSLNVGGYACNITPSNNYTDHGFYQISPVLLYSYYVANGFEIVDSTLLIHDPMCQDRVWKFMDYKPGAINLEVFCRDKTCSYAIIARKTERSTAEVIPVQYYDAGEGGGTNIHLTRSRSMI